MNPHDFDPYEDMADAGNDTRTRQAQGEQMKTYYRDFRGGMTEATTEGRYGDYCKYEDVRIVLAQNKELRDRLAQVEKGRDELKRGKSCEGCESFDPFSGYTDGPDSPCVGCCRFEPRDNFKPRDPSAEQRESK